MPGIGSVYVWLLTRAIGYAAPVVLLYALLPRT